MSKKNTDPFRYNKLKRKMEIVPTWAWYVGSMFIGGPIGLLVVYLCIKILSNAAQQELEDAYASSSFNGDTNEEETGYRDPHVVRGEDYVVQDDIPSSRPSPQSSTSSPTEEFSIPVDAGSDEVIEICRRAMSRIRRANDLIPDPTLTSQINEIESSCNQILDILQQRPEVLSQLRTFFSYYLPTTLRLLEARARLERSAFSPKARSVRQRINKAIGMIDTAFKNQVESLDELRFVDLESEMDVLSSMLKADGLISDDPGTSSTYVSKGGTT